MAIQRKQFTTEVGGKTLTLEISSFASQANAAVLVKYGETVVLATAVMTRNDEKTDYLPLKVDYEEKFYAVGKILGSRFMRREGRASDEAILTGRMIDRVIRPLFDYRLRRGIQVVTTVLAYDEENKPDFPALVGASAALAMSDIPWAGPVAGLRMAKIGEKFVINPTNSEMKQIGLSFETFAAGPYDRINMIELAGNEAQEIDISKAFEMAQKEINTLVELQKSIVKEIGKPKTEVKLFEPTPEIRANVEEFISQRLEEALYHPTKMEQQARLHALKEELFSHLKEKMENPDLNAAFMVFEEILDHTVHKNILESDKRPDGRGLAEVRKLEGEVGLFERTHGSAFFARGNTQALAVTTLGSPGAEQIVETMSVSGKRKFMLHYNFPPYSTGEIGNFRGPGRREIGHGALAEKALLPMLPPSEVFPYTIRVVSEILSSNGSSSMATVCASTLSLMDAGVPLKKPVAGIAMGLMLSEAKSAPGGMQYKILTDLQGPEDFYGDMDFKVAGTEGGVNAMQLDVKVNGLTMEIIEKTFAQARAARLEILSFMKTVLAAPREKLSPHVPIIVQIAINPDKIGIVIGPGGKMINGLIKELGLASIDIEEDGRVSVSGLDPAKVREAIEEIKAMTREFKIGEIIEGRVIKTLDFGAIVDLGGGKDGMIHVSELKEGFVKTVEEVVNVGDFVRAKIIRADADGRIGLSIKQLEK